MISSRINWVDSAVSGGCAVLDGSAGSIVIARGVESPASDGGAPGMALEVRTWFAIFCDGVVGTGSPVFGDGAVRTGLIVFGDGTGYVVAEGD